MAKQASLHKMDGKADGRSYFYSQNGGYQSRAINPGMSKRVKESPEYANTRRNNAEYGVAAKYAGYVISTFSGHWRFMLHKNIIGKMIKDVHAMITSNAGVWGQRALGTEQEKVLIPLLNKYGKRNLPDEFASQFTDGTVYYNEDDHNNVFINNGGGMSPGPNWGEQLRSVGADCCDFQLVALRVPEIFYNSQTDSYQEGGGVEMRIIGTDSVGVGSDDTIFNESFDLPSTWNFDSYDAPMSLGLLVLPYKRIGTTKYTLQELCSFKFVTPIPGEYEG